MSSANANSSRKSNKLELVQLGGITVEFNEKDIVILPNKNELYDYTEEKGVVEIKAYDTAINKDGRKVNAKGKEYKTSKTPKRNIDFSVARSGKNERA